MPPTSCPWAWHTFQPKALKTALSSFQTLWTQKHRKSCFGARWWLRPLAAKLSHPDSEWSQTVWRWAHLQHLGCGWRHLHTTVHQGGLRISDIHIFCTIISYISIYMHVWELHIIHALENPEKGEIWTSERVLAVLSVGQVWAGSCLLELFGGICLSLTALLFSKQDLAQSSGSSWAKTAVLLIMWCNYVSMADPGFALLELGDLMASLKYKISEDRASKYLSQIIGFNITAGQKCFLNQMNFRRKFKMVRIIGGASADSEAQRRECKLQVFQL